MEKNFAEGTDYFKVIFICKKRNKFFDSKKYFGRLDCEDYFEQQEEREAGNRGHGKIYKLFLKASFIFVL